MRLHKEFFPDLGEPLPIVNIWVEDVDSSGVYIDHPFNAISSPNLVSGIR